MTNFNTQARERPPYGWAALLTAVVLAIYLATLAPTTAFWDTSEYIAAAYVLGIPHPPGNPLFVLLAHTFGAIPLPFSYAVRINLFAALTSALSAGLWFLVAERWMRNVVPARWPRLAAAAAGILVSATMWTVWNQSTVNEKVYTVSLLSIALVTWLAVHWADDEPGPHRDRWLILIAYVLALSSTNHMMGVLAAPAVAVYVLWTDWRVLTRPWVLAGIVVAFLVGISLNYSFLPIRAAQFPAINEGEPVGFFSQALSDVLNRVQYGKPSVFERQADFAAQLANYWQYFSWQFARDWGRAARFVTAIFTVLGLVGAWALWVKDRRAALASTALIGTLTLLLVFYLNFKYGYSIYPTQPDLPREVRERDYFFIGSFAAFGVWIAVGFGALVNGIVSFLRDRGTERGRWALATIALALAAVPLMGNRLTASRSGESMARDFAVDLLESVEPYGILITAGDNDTFPLWYAQEVEGVRRDVTLANLSLMNTRWHLRQLRRRNTPKFDPSTAAQLWREPPPSEPAIELKESPSSSAPAAPPAPLPADSGSAPPAGSVLSLSEAQLDSLPEITPVPKGSGLRIGGIELAFGDQYLMLQDLASIALIRDNLGKRPIYFSWSDGGYPDRALGLTPYLVTQGLVRKLESKPVVPSDSIVLSRGLGYLDLPRTKRLLTEVYHYRSAGRDRPRGWVDEPSSSILQLYAVIYGAAANSFRERGDSAQAVFADSVTKSVAENIKGGS